MFSALAQQPDSFEGDRHFRVGPRPDIRVRPPKHLATPDHSPHLSFTSIFPKFSPLNNLRKAVGAFSMPCSIVSFHAILPSCIHLDISLWNSGIRSKWFAMLNPSSRRHLPMTNMMLRGPLGSPISLYCEIIPQIAKRANGLAAASAASRCSPPAFSK